MTRILIAEDEERIVTFLERGLRGAGYSTHAVHTGPDALGLARDDHFELMLLDLGLPGLDGQEVLRQVRDVAAQLDPHPDSFDGSANTAAGDVVGASNDSLQCGPLPLLGWSLI